MARLVEIEDQASVTSLDSGEILDLISDDADSSLTRFRPSAVDGLIDIEEGNPEYNVIRACFFSGLGPDVANDTTIVTIRKNSPENSVTTKARNLAFKAFQVAVASKNGGDANVRYGWYAGSKEEIGRIVSIGFSGHEIVKFANEAEPHGVGIHLIPSNLSLIAALGTDTDEEGLRHLLLCRIILGNLEPIISTSKQMFPSSSEFDSGVDDPRDPRKYIIWSCSMNSYILPSHVVSFKSPRLRDLSRELCLPRPSSMWVSFPVLMSMLSKSLEPWRMNLILKTYSNFRKGKLRRNNLVQKMREVAGDSLLAHIIKNYKNNV